MMISQGRSDGHRRRRVPSDGGRPCTVGIERCVYTGIWTDTVVCSAEVEITVAARVCNSRRDNSSRDAGRRRCRGRYIGGVCCGGNAGGGNGSTGAGLRVGITGKQTLAFEQLLDDRRAAGLQFLHEVRVNSVHKFCNGQGTRRVIFVNSVRISIGVWMG